MLPLVKASDVFSWSAMDADTLVKMPKEMLPEDKNTRSVVKYQAEEALVKVILKNVSIRKKQEFSSERARRRVV